MMGRIVHLVGIAVLMIAFLPPAIGLLVMTSRRHAVDRAASYETDGRAAHSRHEGWKESQSAPRLGFYGSIAPLVLGAVAAFLGARKMRDEATPFPRAFAVVTGTVALLTSAGAFAASRGPLPPDPPLLVARLQDARSEIERVSGGGLGAGCFDLEHAVEEHYWHAEDRSEWPRRFDPELRKTLPDYDELAARCIHYRMPFATQNDLLATPLLVDEAQKKAIEGWVGPTSWSPSDSTVVDSKPAVTIEAVSIRGGKLSPVVLDKVMKHEDERFRFCVHPEGTIHVTLEIRANGSVASATLEPIPNPCVVQALESLSFPERYGEGTMTVRFVLAYQPNT